MKAGEELTVEYGYDHHGLGKDKADAPEWYKIQLREHQTLSKDRDQSR